MRKYYDYEENVKRKNKFRTKLMSVLPAAFTRKEQLRLFAEANPNLAFGKNEYGEVSELKRQNAIQRLFDENKFALFFKRLKKPVKRVAIFVPLLVFGMGIVMTRGYLLVQNLVIMAIIGVIFFLLYFVVRKLAGMSKDMSLTEIANSKVVLADHYLEYSYSTLNPKNTENDVAANFVVKRIAYNDITNIYYYDKTGFCEVKGKYKYIKYYNYKIGQENPKFIETDMNGVITLFDVYTNRDLFAEISQRANVTPVYGIEKKKNMLSRSMWTTFFVVMSGIGFLLLLEVFCYLVYLFL